MATVGAASRLLAELEILENCTAKDLEDVEFEVTAKTKSGGELTVTVLKIHKWSELNMGVCEAHIRGLNLCTCIYLVWRSRSATILPALAQGSATPD